MFDLICYMMQVVLAQVEAQIIAHQVLVNVQMMHGNFFKAMDTGTVLILHESPFWYMRYTASLHVMLQLHWSAAIAKATQQLHAILQQHQNMN